VQHFVSKEAGERQDSVQFEDRTRSIQQFISKEADERQYPVQSEDKTRSVQQFISKKAETAQHHMYPEGRTRSVQQFKSKRAYVTQRDIQFEDRPRSILDFIPKRPTSNEAWTRGDVSSMKEEIEDSSLPPRSHSGANTPLLGPTDEISIDSFDHKFSIPIGYSTGVFTEIGTLRDHVVQFSSNEGWHSARSQLVDIAKCGSSSLVPTRYVFQYQDHYFICSERADACLADVIDCSFSMTEDAASAILTQVS